MNGFAVGLILSSTFMHAGWNLLARSQRSEGAFLFRSLWIIVAAGIVPAVLLQAVMPPLPARAWWCVAVSGVFCGTYYLGLARAYESGDFTVVYPVARALPVLLVGLGDVLRRRPPSVSGWTGMLLVAGACLVMPLRSMREFSRAAYLNRTTLWVLVTAFSTVGYTMVDKFAAEALSAGPISAARYEYVFFAIAAFVYTGFLKAAGGRHEDGRTVGWRRPSLAALLNFGAYLLVIWAYQLTRHAGYVVAFRQFSIVIGVVAGLVLFRERGAVHRLIATLVMVAGLVLIGLYG